MMAPFHLVEMSFYPVMASFGGMVFISSLVLMFSKSSYFIIVNVVGLVFLSVLLKEWWEDVINESLCQGFHTSTVVKGVKIGFMIFILSEVCFFASFFWTFFHSSLVPVFDMSNSWPPVGLVVLDPMSVPLLNTVILLSSGFTVTSCHHYLLTGNNKKALFTIILTVILGAIFTSLQAMEYVEASFTFSDSCYGSCFFIMTGFHGFHVLIGTIFLLVCLFRIKSINFSSNHHSGFEAAAWYWHFVDVVWLFLFFVVYLWGSF